MDNIVLHGLDPRLDDILADTYYQLIYQEQVTAIAVQLAGWTEGEADGIRKTIGRKIQSELDLLIPRLTKDFISHGMNPDSAKTLSQAIQACGGYNFNKSHAYEYGLIAYQTAYLKANYPIEYMASVLNANIDNTEEALPYISECQDMGIEILPPSIKVGNLKFQPDGEGIRIGLSFIKGINQINYKYYENIYSFFKYNKLNKRQKEALIKAGALDCFGETRPQLINIAFDINEEKRQEHNKITIARQKISDKQKEISISKQGTKKIALLKNQIINQQKAIDRSLERIKELERNNSDYDIIQGEMDVLGFTFQDKFSEFDKSQYSHFNPSLTISQIILAEVVNFKKIKDRKGRDMAFVTAIPHLGKKQEFVMFSNYYQELQNKVYGLVIERGNLITDVAKPIKK